MIENQQSGFDNNYIKMNSNESNEVDNNLFKNDEDIMVSENKSKDEEIVSYFCLSSDSQFSSVINIISSAIGGGCLNFPSILGQIGLPITISIFIFISLSIYYTIDLLRNFVVDTKIFSFALMTNDILGSNWLKVYTINSLIFYLSVEINYLSEIYTIISNKIGFSGNNEVISNLIYFLLSLIIEIYICIYISKIQKIHILSLISFLLFFIFLIILIIQGIINIINGPGDKLSYESLIFPEIKNNVEYFFRLMSFFIEFLYGYSYHSSYPMLLSNLRVVEHRITKKIHLISFIIISFSYLLITFFGFFLRASMSDILFVDDNNDNPSLQNNILINIFKIILCLFLFTLVPLRFIVIRDNYTSLIKKENKFTLKQELITVSLCLFFCNLIVFLTNESIIKFNIVSNFIQLFGGIFGVVISYILPVINYVGVNGKRKVKSIIGYILAGIFSIIGILSVGYSIYGLIIQNDYDK